MEVLSSPLEALVFNYLSLDGFLMAANNIWTWLAVVTAAISFWRFRVLSSPQISDSTLRGSSLDGPSRSSPPPLNTEAEQSTRYDSVEAKNLSSTTSRTMACPLIERQGSTKWKFTVSYDEDHADNDHGDDNVDGRASKLVMSEDSRWFCVDEWERIMGVRMGDMGWYRYQDLAVLDGSVVRLWDRGLRQRNAAEVLAGGCVTWEVV